MRGAPFTAHNLQFIARIANSLQCADLQTHRIGRYVLGTSTTDLFNAFPITERR